MRFPLILLTDMNKFLFNLKSAKYFDKIDGDFLSIALWNTSDSYNIAFETDVGVQIPFPEFWCWTLMKKALIDTRMQ